MRPTPFSRPAGQLAANRFSTTATRSTAATAPIAHQLNINPNAPPPDAGTGLTVTASADTVLEVGAGHATNVHAGSVLHVVSR